MPQDNFESIAQRAGKLMDELLTVLSEGQRMPGLDYNTTRSLDSIRTDITGCRRKIMDIASRKQEREQQPQLRQAPGGTSDTAAKIASLYSNARVMTRDQVERTFQEIERVATMSQLEDAAKAMGLQQRFRSQNDAISYMKNAILERMGVAKRVNV